MSWLLAFILALVAFGTMVFVLKAPRKGWEVIGAALLLGIAGYGLQASPNLRGAPKAAVETVSESAADVVAARSAMAGGKGTGGGDNWTVIADALARHGQYADAASVLLGAVEKKPDDGDAWLAMANALVGHAEGTLSPAALYAFRRASQAAPDHPGPPFFLGLAMAQSGQLAEGRALWADLLRRTPADAPWRADLVARLADLDAFIARQQARGQQSQGNVR